MGGRVGHLKPCLDIYQAVESAIRVIHYNNFNFPCLKSQHPNLPTPFIPGYILFKSPLSFSAHSLRQVKCCASSVKDSPSWYPSG